MLLGFSDSHAYQVCATCGRRIGMRGYSLVVEDGHTCFILMLSHSLMVALLSTYPSTDTTYLCWKYKYEHQVSIRQVAENIIWWY